MDSKRKKMIEALEASRTDMQSLSLAVGKHRGYFHQFLKRGAPEYLPMPIAIDAAQRLDGGLDWREYVAPVEREMAAPLQRPDPDLVEVDELDVRAAAGAGATVEQLEPAQVWRIPKVILGGAPAGNVKVISVEGDSMEPTLRHGDRVLVDTGRSGPTPPGMFILWDGTGLLVKRLERVPGGDELGMVRVVSDNPSYATYELHPSDIEIQGRVIWTARNV